MTVDFATPPDDLARFPTRTLRTDVRLYRVHHADLGPCWFSSFPVDHDGGGRFDLSPPRGTSYWAIQAEAAFLETIARRPVAIIPLELLDRFHLSVAEIPADIVAANSPVKPARGFGLTAEFHTTADYLRTREWAVALDAAGHPALISIPRHDVSVSLRSVVLFGEAGEHPPFDWTWNIDTGPIPPSIVDSMAAWGIRCLPIPFDVDVIEPSQNS